MKVLYFDCFSGISGDMTLGALLDLGLNPDHLLEALKKLPLDGYELIIEKGMKNGITGTNVNVLLPEEKKAQPHHDHDHAREIDHDHGDHHHDDHHHDHSHKHEHLKEDGHNHGDHTHQHQRSYKDIKALIEQSALSDNVKEMAIRIFTKLAHAEGKIHGQPFSEVAFHEVGAVDSIVDIVGVAILLDMLSIDTFVTSPLPLGSGMVKCQHGLIPVPAPATLELLKGIPVYSKNIKGEMVTPTGAAIISTICTEFGEFPAMTVEQIGYGMGKKTFDIPNCLRVCVGEVSKK